MTVVLVDPRVAPAGPDMVDQLDRARRHRPDGAEDLCAACGWHWPCPAFFQARYALIRAGVDPGWWA